MSFFISDAMAQAGGEQADPLMSFLPLIFLIVVFYFLLIRPQQKRQKEHQQKIEAIKKGDQVVTAGGLVGKVHKVDDNYVELDLAQSVRVKAVKNTIGDIIPPGGSAAND